MFTRLTGTGKKGMFPITCFHKKELNAAESET